MRTQRSTSFTCTFLVPLLLACLIQLLINTIHNHFPLLASEQPHIHAILHFLIVTPFIYFFLYKPRKDKHDHNQEHINAMSRAHQMLLTVLDSLDAIVYVADIKTHEMLFLNRFTRDIFGNGIGKPCWQVMQTDQTG
ncbi:MAG: hypothetical protein OEL66_05120, partial [Desulfobulbaceae bacterium]|nr:hypothetical protein [Desulfobulbaceae bacterium]